jgi:hypothetical protein
MIKRSILYIAVVFTLSFVMVEASNRPIFITEQTPLLTRIDQVKADFSALLNNIKSLAASIKKEDVDEVEFYSVYNEVKDMFHALRKVYVPLYDLAKSLHLQTEKECDEREYLLEEELKWRNELKKDVEVKIRSLPE